MAGNWSTERAGNGEARGIITGDDLRADWQPVDGPDRKRCRWPAKRRRQSHEIRLVDRRRRIVGKCGMPGGRQQQRITFGQ
jgi:hypothetical protein